MSEQIIISLVGFIISLVFYVAAIVLQHVSSSPGQHAQVVGSLAHMVVAAVEQSAPLLEGPGKKQMATDIIVEVLSSMGIKGVSPVLIDAAIEAAVHRLNVAAALSSKESPSPPAPQLDPPPPAAA